MTNNLEQAKTSRAMAALDTMATTWAMTFDIRKAVKAMMSLPDGEDRLIAFVKQAHCEGLYVGRTSLATQPEQAAIDKLGAAIERALDEAPVSDVLSVLTGAFVGLTVELVRRQGHDVAEEIKVAGGRQRDITIHAPKELGHG